MNTDIPHTKATFKDTPNLDLNRQAKLSSRKEDNCEMRINERYHDHAITLTKSEVSMKMFPTLKELWENTDQKEKKRKENIGKKTWEGNNLSVSDYNKRGKR